MDRMTLGQRIEANLLQARKGVCDAVRIAHEARNIRQRVWGDRYLRALRRSRTLGEGTNPT